MTHPVLLNPGFPSALHQGQMKKISTELGVSKGGPFTWRFLFCIRL